MSKTIALGLTGSEKSKVVPPFADLSALKRSTDLAAVVQARGVKLAKQGADMVGLCPFHEEKTPSFRVTPSKNLFHCFGCGAAGSVIDFVMKKDGLDKQGAIDWLIRQSHGAVRRADDLAELGIKNGELRMESQGASPQVTDTARATLLKRVVSFYAKTLMQDRDGFDYLKRRNLADPTALEVFQVGYCNGTLNKALPRGGEIVEQLKAIGILNKHGRESFFGRVTVPIFDAQGNVCGLYGRRLTDEEPKHLYLKGERRGVWNSTAAKLALSGVEGTNQTLFVAEAILDGLALWQAGFKNVIAIYGTEGFTPDHEKLLRENPLREVFLCLDNDEAGRAATERLKEKLPSLVKFVHVIQWPEEVKDACDFFLSRSAADFESLVPSKAQRDKGTEAQSEAEEMTMTADGFIAAYGSRRYELRAIEKPTAARLKATVKASSNAPTPLLPTTCVKRGASSAASGRFHIDTVDFFLSRSRRGFLIEAARLFQETPEVIEMDVNRLITQLETYVEKRAVESSPRVALVSEPDQAEAQRLGRSPDLVHEILRDVERLGVVGEGVNVLLHYLAMTSRKLDDPLAVHTLSSSGAGKSHLQDVVLSLCPEEDLIKVTSLSDRALFYKGENSLCHKVLAIEEVAGAFGARYAVRNLISQKILTVETTIKNPLTGKMETQVNTVRGPAAVFETTTEPETDAETKSRFIITTVDESAGQTRAIVEAQRQRHTVEGWERKLKRGEILRRHHAFQRLLKPVRVVNPWEPLLSYGDDRLLFRRDHPKYLELILAVAFLHQMQRPVKSHPGIGDYIEVALDDIAIANDLALQLFGHALDDLSPPSRELLRLIRDYVERRAAELKVEPVRVEFNRRELRQALKWSEYRLRCHLRELERMEYLLPVAGRHGQLYSYRLLDDVGEDEGRRHLPGLKSVEQIRQEAEKGGFVVPTSLPKMALRWSKSNFVGTSLRPTNEVLEGGFPSQKRNGKANFVAFSRGHIPGKLNGKRVEVGA